MASDSDWINGRPSASLALNDHDWDQFMKRVIVESLFNSNEHLFSILGESEAVERLKPSMRISGIAFANNARQIFGIEGNDIQSTRQLLHIFQASMGVGAPTEERVGDEVCEWNGPRDCLWLSSSSATCRLGEALMDSIAQSVNPSYRLRIACMKHEGGSTCHYILETRHKVSSDGRN